MAYEKDRDKMLWVKGCDVSEQVSIQISVHQYDGGEPKLRIGRFLNNYGKAQSPQPIKVGGLTLNELDKISDLITEGKKVLADAEKDNQPLARVRRALNESEA